MSSMESGLTLETPSRTKKPTASLEKRSGLNMSEHVFTSESVCEGHPDKVCDQISDAILDAVLKQDPAGRVACECLVTTGLLLIAGEITSRASVDYAPVARETIRDIGYTDARFGFDYKTCGILNTVQRQSPDIAMGVDTGGAGDQGMMFGYASDETEEFMPLPILLAHKLARELAHLRKSGKIPYLRPDGKTQVSVRYDQGVPESVEAIVVSAQHDGEVTIKTIEKDMRAQLIARVVPEKFITKYTRIFVNPTGRFEIGGPHGDTGLTGRKIIVDTYGGVGAHGGGALSGKDPTKVDRSACYFARYAAKNLVAAGVARRVEMQVAYAIGVAEPVSIMVDTFGTGQVADEIIERGVRRVFDFRPKAMIEHLKLRRPIYRPTAAYGHFGRNEEGFSWELTDKVDEIRREIR